MLAKEFVNLLLNECVKSYDTLIYVSDGNFNEQFFDASFSYIDKKSGAVILVARLNIEDDDSEWIRTAKDLQQWFFQNSIKPTDTIIFENHFATLFTDVNVIGPNKLQLANSIGSNAKNLKTLYKPNVDLSPYVK